MKLKDKVAIITGGASGIGKAIAERYAQEGARVVIADIDEKAASELTDKLGSGAFAVQFDVTKQESIDNLVGAVVQRAGRIDILVNNAGIFAMAPSVDVTREQWHKLFAYNK
jgi:NAD(P)-dependent dehydrogenase (short-subunit alcohol dehydrogenase family)